jgi:hypothetical protein
MVPSSSKICGFAVIGMAAALGVGAAQVSPVDRAESKALGMVQVVAFDEATGRILPPPEVRLFQAGEQKNLAAKFHAGEVDDIPYGTYRIEAVVPGYTPELRYISVNQPRATVVLGMPVSPIENVPYPSIRGHIVGDLPLKKSFIRLVGIYNGQLMETAIEPDGTFGFSGVRCCKYLLLIIGDGGIIASKDITISDATLAGKITVSLNNPPLEIEINRAIGRTP